MREVGVIIVEVTKTGRHRHPENIRYIRLRNGLCSVYLHPFSLTNAYPRATLSFHVFRQRSTCAILPLHRVVNFSPQFTARI